MLELKEGLVLLGNFVKVTSVYLLGAGTPFVRGLERARDRFLESTCLQSSTRGLSSRAVYSSLYFLLPSLEEPSF